MTANIIAGLSFLLSMILGLFYLRDRRLERFNLETEYTNNLLRWHGEVMRTLTRLRLGGADYRIEHQHNDLALLSALIEEGRFFFPNIDRGNNFGNTKPPAYRGYRNLTLDFLIALYNLYSDWDYSNTSEHEKAIKKARNLERYFTSVVFEMVEPVKRLEIIRELTRKYFMQKKSFEDFIKTNDSSIIENIWR